MTTSQDRVAWVLVSVGVWETRMVCFARELHQRVTMCIDSCLSGSVLVADVIVRSCFYESHTVERSRKSLPHDFISNRDVRERSVDSVSAMRMFDWQDDRKRRRFRFALWLTPVCCVKGSARVGLPNIYDSGSHSSLMTPARVAVRRIVSSEVFDGTT